MATNKIQIKRSVANSVVTGLSNGELAFTANGNLLYIGDPAGGAAIPIGSKLNFGTLTANSVLVTNATSAINEIIVGDIVLTGTTQTVTANGGIGSVGHVLISGGTANAYWAPASALTGTVNTAAAYTWTNTHTYQNTVAITGGLTVNSSFTANGGLGTAGQVLVTAGAGNVYWASLSTLTGGVNTAAQFIWTNTHVFQTGLSVGNSSVFNITNTSLAYTGNTTLGGTNTVISSNLITTGASIIGTATDVSFRNGTFSGNLTVSGTVVTVNTAQLQVNDNIIQLAYNQTTTDTVDTGFSSVAGNSSSVWYSGIARIAASSTNAAPVFRVFGSNTNPNTSSTIDTSANTRTGFLQSYLIPYGTGGALVVNATNISVTGNSTLAVSVSANTLTLSGRANNDLLISNGTGGVLGVSFNTTAGYVLQSNGTAIVYDTLDGGTF